MSQALSNLSVGATVEVTVKNEYQSILGQTLVFKIADKNHTGYPANSVTLITDKIIALLPFDAKEPSNSNADRKISGNNRYSVSNLLQWLNSSSSAGIWYSAKHAADTPPNAAGVSVNPYDAWAGFLEMLDNNFMAALIETTQTVVRNTVTDGGGSESVTSKIFLASATEMGLANENNIAEGSKLSMFTNDTSRIAYCTQAAIDTSQNPSDPTIIDPWYYIIRTPYAANSINVRNVDSSGLLNIGNSAYIGSRGVRPLCNLPSLVLITDFANANGNYEFIWDTAPNISTHFNGEWKNSTPYIKQSGVWKPVTKAYVKHSGAWKETV